MKINVDLLCRKSTGQLVGFTELGNINDELRLFESRVKSEEYRQDFATHVIVYMAHVIFTNVTHFDFLDFHVPWKPSLLLKKLDCKHGY